MRRTTYWFLGAALLWVAAGCSDSGGDGAGGSGATGGSGGSGGNLVTVSGTVGAATLDGPSTPLEGATVSIEGGGSTTSGPGGAFSLEAPVGTVMVEATAEGHWSSLFAENVPAGGLTDVEVEVVPDALVTAVAGALGTTPDTSKGIVAVFFDETTVSGGESASISVGSELSFVFDSDDNPVEGDTLIAGGGTDVIFVNTDIAASVSATTLNASSQPCALEYPSASYSVQSKTFTAIDVYCP